VQKIKSRKLIFYTEIVVVAHIHHNITPAYELTGLGRNPHIARPSALVSQPIYISSSATILPSITAKVPFRKGRKSICAPHGSANGLGSDAARQENIDEIETRG
jgi:hypothetical protein